MMKLAVGEVVQNYRVDRFLGRGGFASVYLDFQEVREFVKEINQILESG